MAADLRLIAAANSIDQLQTWLHKQPLTAGAYAAWSNQRRATWSN